MTHPIIHILNLPWVLVLVQAVVVGMQEVAVDAVDVEGVVDVEAVVDVEDVVDVEVVEVVEVNMFFMS